MSDKTIIHPAARTQLPEADAPVPVWPPADPGAMCDWLAVFGGDAAIARHLGLCQATVANYRRRLGVAALPRTSDRRVRERRPRARLSRRAVVRLYAGRRYEDQALRQRPVNVVRGVGWVL